MDSIREFQRWGRERSYTIFKAIYSDDDHTVDPYRYILYVDSSDDYDEAGFEDPEARGWAGAVREALELERIWASNGIYHHLTSITEIDSLPLVFKSERLE